MSAAGGHDDYVALLQGETQIADDLSRTARDDEHRLYRMRMGLEDLVRFELYPADGEFRRIWHERPELLAPTKVAELAELMNSAPLLDFLDQRNDFAIDYSNLSIHGSGPPSCLDELD